jgi:hypothetical protein
MVRRYVCIALIRPIVVVVLRILQAKKMYLFVIATLCVSNMNMLPFEFESNCG